MLLTTAALWSGNLVDAFFFHGGLDVRYVASVRPDLVASATSVGSPHKGADLADYLSDNFENGSFAQAVLNFFANTLGTVIGLVSGTSNPQDGLAALEMVIGFHVLHRLRGQWVDLPIEGTDRKLEVQIG